MRIMCDTNVLVRTVLSPDGAAAELLRLIGQQHTLVLSLAVLAELYNVLRRPRIRALHGLAEAQIRRIVSRLSKLAIVVHLPSNLPATVPRDSKDNPIVMTAIAGKADVLCTLDRHLHDASVTTLCVAHGVRVLRDAELLVELRA